MPQRFHIFPKLISKMVSSLTTCTISSSKWSCNWDKMQKDKDWKIRRLKKLTTKPIELQAIKEAIQMTFSNSLRWASKQMLKTKEALWFIPTISHPWSILTITILLLTPPLDRLGESSRTTTKPISRVLFIIEILKNRSIMFNKGFRRRKWTNKEWI